MINAQIDKNPFNNSNFMHLSSGDIKKQLQELFVGQGNSNHSAQGSTLWVPIEYCFENNLSFRVLTSEVLGRVCGFVVELCDDKEQLVEGRSGGTSCVGWYDAETGIASDKLEGWRQYCQKVVLELD